jgi:16S rRNA (uracil1498-N3)-methyltransferase
MQTLSEEESIHACKVLRLQNGTHIRIVNGQGLDVTAEIDFIHHKKTTVRLIDKPKFEALQYDLHIAIAPTKMNERMEWFVEKATEIGATSISFLHCQNSERKNINIDRFRRISLSAMKQSQRKHLPKLNDITAFQDFCKMYQNGFIAHCYNSEKKTSKDFDLTDKAIILIGPEGDFSAEEVEYAFKHNYKPLSLGINRLRTETAGIVAVSQFVQRLTNKL